MGMNLTHVGKYLRSPRVARWKKMLGVLSVAYAILPFDFVPDVLPIVGWLDDIGFLAVAFGFIARDMAKNSKLPPEQVPPGAQVIDATPESR